MTYYLGIDVGRAHTVAAVARPGGTIATVDLGDGDAVASVLHLGIDGAVAVGETAEWWALTEPERVARAFAGRVGDVPAVVLAGEPYDAEELTAWLVRWVVDRVAESEGGAATAVAVTHPACWDPDRVGRVATALAEQDLQVTFASTPVALLAADEPDRAVAVVDVGGDVAVVRTAASGLPATVVGTATGPEVDVDDLVVELVRKALPDAFARVDAAEPATAAALVQLRRSCAAAAQAMAVEAEVTVPVLLPDAEGMAVLRRADLDRLLRPRVEESAATLTRTVSAAGLRPREMAAVKLVGGGAWARLFADVVRDMPAAAVARDAVARGAALALQASHDTGAFPVVSNDETAVGGGAQRDQIRFIAGLGATNTAGLLSGYTPAHGTPAVPAEVAASEPVPPAQVAGRDPVVLVSAGGLAAALAVVGTIFLWPAPGTADSATIRPLVPVAPVAAPSEPAVTPSVTPTVDEPSAQPRRTRDPQRIRRPAVAPTPSVVPTVPPTVPPSGSEAPTASLPPETTPSSPPSEDQSN